MKRATGAASTPTRSCIYMTDAATDLSVSAATLDADWLRTLCLDAGADDVGFVEIAHGDRRHSGYNTVVHDLIWNPY